MVVTTADGLRQILYVGQLAARRGIRKVAGKLGELGRRGGITAQLGSLGGACQVRGDLLSNLLVPGWVRLLKLL